MSNGRVHTQRIKQVRQVRTIHVNWSDLKYKPKLKT